MAGCVFHLTCGSIFTLGCVAHVQYEWCIRAIRKSRIGAQQVDVGERVLGCFSRGRGNRDDRELTWDIRVIA